jgi:hypothetical protein
MLPIIKTRFPVDNIPWDRVNQDLTDAMKSLPPHSGTDANADNSYYHITRRDLEPWAKGFQDHMMSIILPLLPWAKTTRYSDLAFHSWFNRYRQNGGTVKHYHYDSEIVAVWYLKSPGDDGYLEYEWDGTMNKMPVTTGDLLIFPGDIGHGAGKNTTKEPRVSMATNFSCISLLKDKIPKEAVDKLLAMRRKQLNLVLSKE